MHKNENLVKYELLECNEIDSDSSEELLSRRFDGDDVDKIATYSYDPHAFSTARHPTSYSETFVNFFKALVGIGIFSLPAAFAEVGFISGTFGLLVITYLSVYCAKILVDVQYELSKRRHVPSLNFQDTVEAAFKDGPHRFSWLAPSLNITIKFLINILTFGSACVYNVVIAENLKVVLDPWWGETSIRLYMLYLMIPLVLINLIRNLKFIAPLSAISNVVLVATIFSVLVFIFQTTSSLNHGHAFVDWKRLPQFSGTVFFAMSCITMILPLKNEMKRPGDFARQPCGVLATGSVTVILLYWVFALFGYLKYGDSVAESITLNLPKGHIAPKIVQGGLALAIFLSTPINNYVLFEILVDDFLIKTSGRSKVIWEYLIHIIVVVASVAISCAIPNLNLLVSLLGVGANSILSMAVPSIIHLMTISNLSTFSKLMDHFIIFLSFIFMVTGTVENLTSIVHLYTS